MLLMFLQIDHIFLSRVSSETAGGLPGLFVDVPSRNLCINYLNWLFERDYCCRTLNAQPSNAGLLLTLAGMGEEGMSVSIGLIPWPISLFRYPVLNLI